jgi:hypothetical protein
MDRTRGVTRLITGAALAVAATAGVIAAPARVVHATSASPGFGQRTPSGIAGDGFEQDVALNDTVAGNHVVFTSAPVGSTTGISNIWRSLDGGQTFKFIPATIGGDTGGHPVSCPAGGGDSELAVDSAGHLYFADLYLGDFSVARSDDNGTSFAPVPSCTATPTDKIVDRQWYATDGDPTNGGALFLVYDRFVQAEVACPGSGSSFTGNALVITRSPALSQAGSTAGNLFTPSTVLSCDEGIMGNDAFFNYPCTLGPNCNGGQSPEVFVIQDNANLNSVSMNRCDVVAESVSNPQGLQNCVHNLISSFPTGRTGASFPTMSIDKAGHLFAVWEQAPVDGSGNVTGDTVLMFSTSSDQGNTWTAPAELPTLGVHNHVMAWPAAGDAGRIDVAYYGTPTAWQTGDVNGPDSVSGDWSLYLAQTLDNGASWSNTLASEHFVFRGAPQSLIGGQTGNRDLGDFLKVQVGPQGEANISYSDDNNPNYNNLNPEAFFVRQNSGPSVFASQDNGAGPGLVNLPAAPAGPCISDPSGDATYDSAQTVGSNNPNLDITQYCMSDDGAGNYKITMTIAGLTSLGPDPSAGANTNIWQVQWHVPSTSDPHGGALFMAYAESVSGGAQTCWVGQASELNAEITYPGSTQLSAADCQVTLGSPGTITITVPKTDVSEVNPIDSTLYAVAASTQTVIGNAELNPQQATGGVLPNLIDVAPAFDLQGGPVSNVPETPWVPALIVVATSGAAVALGRRARGRRTA